jgi:hypothetical protein
VGGKAADKLLPESVCRVVSDFDPLEMLRIETRYPLRGERLIEQTVKQQADPNPRGRGRCLGKRDVRGAPRLRALSRGTFTRNVPPRAKACTSNRSPCTEG